MSQPDTSTFGTEVMTCCRFFFFTRRYMNIYKHLMIFCIMPDHFFFLECALKVSTNSSWCLLTLEDSVLTVFPMYKKQLGWNFIRVWIIMVFKKWTFFFLFFIFNLGGKFPTPYFCCIMFLCNFHKSSLILSLLQIKLFHCRLRSLNCAFFCFFNSLDCIKKWWHVFQLSSI